MEQLNADWTEEGAFRAIDSLLSKPHNEFDCVFAHNDRMAMGARRAAEKHGLDLSHIKICGIDAMPAEWRRHGTREQRHALRLIHLPHSRR